MTIKPRAITPYLWFNDKAEEAAKFYVSLFEGSKITGEMRPDPSAPPLIVNFNLAGTDFIALNGGPNFTLNEAFSIFVQVDTQEQVDELWNKLTANGGEESKCGWLKDRYGLSWQIIPQTLLDRLSDKDPVKAKRAMDAMLQMQKIDIDKIERAYAGR
ncbi:MAG: VOC family protein [Candidatus Rokuibacteriota bacterium]